MLSCTLQLYLHLNTSQITQFAPCKPGEFAILAPKHISNIICRRNLSSRYRHRVSSAAAPLHLQSHHEVIKPNSSTNVIATSPFHISFARPQFPVAVQSARRFPQVDQSDRAGVGRVFPWTLVCSGFASLQSGVAEPLNRFLRLQLDSVIRCWSAHLDGRFRRRGKA
jgi:hypothetical protein